MPAIRGVAFNATTVANGSTIILPMPTSEQNDLLIAIICADTGTGTWTPPTATPAWTALTGTPVTNTAQLAVFYRIAGTTEPASYTFTRSATESFTGCIISVRDINTTNPFGSTIVSAITNQSAAKFNMTRITTTVPNSLVLYAFASSSAGTPSFLEGPVYGLLGSDGLAEGLGVGWGFQPTTSLTPANVGCSNHTAGAGVALTLQIAAPASGATVIPTYVTGDLSTYINPLNGTTAYNGDTAVAATADTNYGSPIGGFTIGDASIAATTDVGINSFHSVPRLTSVSGSINPAGAELVLAAANRLNVTGKNILCHVGPSTEGQTQRFSTIASTRGIWFGMRSNTGSGGGNTGWKIWQVYGLEKGSLRHQPIVINEASTTTRATSGTLDPLVITSFAWWVSGNSNATTIWDIASLWMLSTTTVVGGTVSEPVTIASITDVVAVGKERKSVIGQGSGQAIMYQPIQIGNGTTADPTYLNLNGSAIEFPRQYNAATLDVQYHSVDNVVGITYNAGSSDTIIHTNASVSSRSRYHWRFASSFSTASNYSFDSLNVIGAGDIQLVSGLILNSVTFNDYVSINANGVDFLNCSFLTVSNTSTAITSNAATSFDSCEISTTNLTAGRSFIRVADPTIFTNCQFSGSTTTGHAIEITSTGTYNFSGNLFSSYGGTGGSNLVANSGSTSAAIYNNSGGLVTLNILNNGTGPSVRNGVGATTAISNPKTFIVRNIAPLTEIRLFNRQNENNLVELGGVEQIDTVSTGISNVSVDVDEENLGRFKITYAYEYSSPIPVYIVAHSKAYQWLRQSSTLDSDGGDVTIVQLADRQYDYGSIS